jgi:hypothetical protein
LFAAFLDVFMLQIQLGHGIQVIGTGERWCGISGIIMASIKIPERKNTDGCSLAAAVPESGAKMILEHSAHYCGS